MQYIWWEWRIVHRSITLLMWKSREFPGHKTWGIQKQNKKTTANAKVEIWLWIIAKCDGHLYVFILFLSCTFYFEYNNHSIILKCTLHSVPAVFFTRVWPQTKISADRCGTDRMCFFAAALGTLHTSVMIQVWIPVQPFGGLMESSALGTSAVSGLLKNLGQCRRTFWHSGVAIWALEEQIKHEEEWEKMKQCLVDFQDAGLGVCVL